MLAKWKSLNIQPSGEISDATFLRRAFLDAAGILPTAEEVEQFLADKSPDKRAKLIDGLLERDEYVDYWAYKWSDLLLVSSRKLRPTAIRAFYNWIRDSVKENKPWDQFAREFSRQRQHAAERRSELLRPAQGPDRADRERHAGIPRPAPHVRPLPQSSAGEMDAEAVLPDGESVLSRGREER